MAVDPGSMDPHHHHPASGHRWLDIILAVSAVFISLMSLFMAIQHGRVMERMVEASTWPYVMAYHSTHDDDGTPHVHLALTNKGVGPARIESLEVFYEGRPMRNSHALAGAILKPAGSPDHLFVLSSDVLHGVIAAKETQDYVIFPPQHYTPEQYAALVSAMGRMQYRVCYCSVFEECAVFDSHATPLVSAVKACPTGGVQFGD
ncbi:MAG TPA: hypothetical protein VMB48_02325 [Steroidobacteraceae bacterium]|nr:hypothetical protein [Steroidobacteraceae bacterium]